MLAFLLLPDGPASLDEATVLPLRGGEQSRIVPLSIHGCISMSTSIILARTKASVLCPMASFRTSEETWSVVHTSQLSSDLADGLRTTYLRKVQEHSLLF